MKTKILYLSTLLVAIFIYSCNKYTLEDVYKQLDSLHKPYNETFSYKLVDADYSTISSLAKKLKTHEDTLAANDINKYKSFGINRDAAKYVPLFLASTFKALDSASAIQLTYKYDNKQTLTNVITIKDTLTYSTISSVNNRLIDTVKKYYPTPNADQFVVIKYTAKTSEIPTYSKAYRLYQYIDGTWSHPSSFYELLKDDYVSMGTSFNTYQNFSSSLLPEFYLPIFLKQKFAYQAPNTYLYVVYEYYSGSATSPVVDKYLYDGTTWTNSEYLTKQFIHNGSVWVFDPTINISFTKDDYQVVVDWVKNQDSIKAYVDNYGTAEYYFGFSAYYQNLDMRLTKRRSVDPNGYLTGKTDEEATKIIWDRIPKALNIYLETKYPTIQPVQNGVEVYFILKVATYEPERHKYTYKFKVVTPGKFQLVTGPTKVE